MQQYLVEPYPLPAFPWTMLSRIGGKMLGNASDAIRSGIIPNTLDRSYSAGQASLENCFNLSNPSNCFHSRPDIWARFTEPQITKGLAYFLLEARPEHSESRLIALLNALLNVSLKKGCHSFSVEAEHTTDQLKRIDLLVRWKSEKKCQCGAVIEAKFGHHLTKKQLSTYRAYATRKLNINPRNLALIVISNGETLRQRKQMNRNRDWVSYSWLDFLRRYDYFIHKNADDQDFRRFRRTVLHHSI